MEKKLNKFDFLPLFITMSIPFEIIGGILNTIQDIETAKTFLSVFYDDTILVNTLQVLFCF